VIQRKHSLAIAAILIVGLVLLAISEIGIRLISKVNPETGMLLIGRFAYLPYRPDAKAASAAWDAAGASTYIVRDADLGWTLKPNGGSGEFTATADGLRGPKNRTTTSTIPAGKIRISVYGDSFTHGDEVEFKDTWADQLEHLHTNMEVLNFGVPAYGTDQAFLRFRRDGRKFDAQFHVLGIWTEDLIRNLSIVRFYLNPQGPLGTSKPRFVLTSGALTVVNSPVLSRQAFMDTVLERDVSAVAERDYWYRDQEHRFPFYYHVRTLRAAISVYNAYHRREIRNRLYFDKQGEALKVSVAIAEAFKNEVEALGARAYVSIIPMRDFLDAHGSGEFPLVEMLKARSIPVLDFGPAFASKAKEVGVEALYLPSGHLTPLGNRLMAEETSKQLARDFESVPN
jgi:hypothetical protein